jgi:ABC-type sulfate transport system permease component
LGKIFDDAVMHHGTKFALMRMGIFVAWFAVSCPASVTNNNTAFELLLIN